MALLVNIFDSFIVFEPGADGNVAPQTTITTSTIPYSVAPNGAYGYAFIGRETKNDGSRATVALGQIYSTGVPPGSPTSAERPFIVPDALAFATSPVSNRAGYSVWTCIASVNPANNGSGSARCFGNPIQINSGGYATNQMFDVVGSPNALVFRDDGALVMANQAVYMRPSNVTTWPMPGEGATAGPFQPLSVLTGSSTGLVSPVGVAFDSVSRSLYVTETGNASYQGSVKVWPATADGNVAPTQVIGGLNYPFGVAVGP